MRWSEENLRRRDLDDAEFAKEEFREKWNKKYPNILKSWDKNWAELTIFFEYPQEIRKIIYTTNAVEGYHRMVRKFTKSKSIFPTDDAIRKVVYMSVSEFQRSGPCRFATGGWLMLSSWFILRTDSQLNRLRGFHPRAPGVYPPEDTGEVWKAAN